MSTTKLGGAQKGLGVTASEFSQCLQAWVEPSPESLPLGASCLCRWARHSQHLYLMHNINSICRLCKLIINILSHIPTIVRSFQLKFFERA